MFSGNEWVILVVTAGVLAVPVLAVVAIVGAASRRKGAGAQPGSAPAQMPGAPPPGWFPDPTGRHEQRYWDGHAWTDAVVSNGQPGTDPI